MTVHVTWKIRQVPGPLKAPTLSWNRTNTDLSVSFSNDDTCLEFVRSEFPDFVSTYLRYPPGMLRADIWRVLVLYRYGGVYADIDVECLRPLEELLAAVGHDDWEI